MPSRSRPRSRSYRRRRGGGSPRRVLLAAAAVVLLASAVGGYLYLQREDADLGICPSQPGPLTFALGARANMPSPELPAALSSLVSSAAEAEQPLVVYRVDGDPSPAVQERFSTTTKAAGPLAEEIKTFTADVLAAMGEIRSVQAEADPLKALRLAARATPAGGTVVLFDSGLQTTAPLDFRGEGMLEADPTEVVASLVAKQAIPELAGRRVILMGLGDVAAPQDQLDPAMRNTVLEIWRAIARAGGAPCVDTLTDPPHANTALTGVRPVSLVKIPKPPLPPVGCGEQRLSNGGDVGFLPGTAELRDPPAARRFLKSYADRFRAVTGEPYIELLGTTARWNTKEEQQRTGKDRAEVVKKILIEYGVPAASITTEGVGSYSKYYRPDKGPEGPLDPAPAAFNRSIIARIVCP
ncbi:OmpA family protein [Catellatospora aurea]|uniref:OmpA family protein n=1 Tax=Catellatospora aurea TaxID=1337874 RepID=A0ABW2H083_9ACTN